MFRIPNFSSLFWTDGYKIGHAGMLAPGTSRLYGTWIPRSLKHGPKGATKIVSFGQQLVVKWLHYEFQENFFNRPVEEAEQFVKDMSKYLNLNYNGDHFIELHKLGYLPLKIQALPEGIETLPNIPHMTFINTVDGFAWLTLFLETFISSLAWKAPTSATIALQYRRRCEEWVMKTDPQNAWLIPYLCHDFSGRGLDPYSQIASGLGHATAFLGSDTLPVIPSARFFYNEPTDQVAIVSVNASEHSVTTTGIFYYLRKMKDGMLDDKIKEYYSFDVPCEGSIENPDYLAIAEWLNLKRWLRIYGEGILSIVSDTFDLWKLITFILPRLKDEIVSRNGKLVVRPDSGDPVDIICGKLGLTIKNGKVYEEYFKEDHGNGSWRERESDVSLSEAKGVIELLADGFGYTVNEQGYKVLPSYIGAIYGDSITLDRQLQIYERLAEKGFASTNIVLGVGSFTYQFNTRDSLGFAAKGAWFETKEKVHGRSLDDLIEIFGNNIYKDPITDDGTKKSLKGFQFVSQDWGEEIKVTSEVSENMAYSEHNLLHLIYEDGKFYNEVTLTQVRERIDKLV